MHYTWPDVSDWYFESCKKNRIEALPILVWTTENFSKSKFQESSLVGTLLRGSQISVYEFKLQHNMLHSHTSDLTLVKGEKSEERGHFLSITGLRPISFTRRMTASDIYNCNEESQFVDDQSCQCKADGLLTIRKSTKEVSPAASLFQTKPITDLGHQPFISPDQGIVAFGKRSSISPYELTIELSGWKVWVCVIKDLLWSQMNTVQRESGCKSSLPNWRKFV